MASKRKFYVNRYLVTLLSEEPLPDAMSLSSIAYEMNEGDCVGEVEQLRCKKVSSKQIVKQLEEVGSDPAFFQLDEEGNDLDE